jgi:hypothetical protein
MGAKCDVFFGRTYNENDPTHVVAALILCAEDILSLRGQPKAKVQFELQGSSASVSARLRALAKHVDEIARYPGKMIMPTLAETNANSVSQVGSLQRVYGESIVFSRKRTLGKPVFAKF